VGPRAILAIVLGCAGLTARAEGTGCVMPLPARQTFGAGELAVTPAWSIALPMEASPRLRAAVDRMLAAWSERTGLRGFGSGSASGSSGSRATSLTLACAHSGPLIPILGADESYTLVITQSGATLQAAEDAGALCGLATLTQLLSRSPQGWSLPVVTIHDAPRFPWRGLLIDVCRHWETREVIERNLDAMALVKLNVLHLHLSDDQGFRVESRSHPELQRQGSDGQYFSQADLAAIVRYAAARCIRVVPEFDMPGHITSWLVSHPELASLPGPYQLKRQAGVFDAVFDPTNERTYALVEDVWAEMCGVFPDQYVHLGGDENNGHQWAANPAIQEFIGRHGLKDNGGLQAYFNQRIDAFLIRRGKRVVGWDEIMHPDLPRDAVIDSWRGAGALAEAVRLGFSGLMAHGYYVDHCSPAAEYYLADPVPEGSRLTAAERARILGGEAAMWSELVGPETIDSRIWPGTAAIAERFWSAEGVRDVADMYRRLAVVSARLTEVGARHERNHAAMLDHLVDLATPATERAALATLVDLLEPEGYHRVQIQFWLNQGVPLTSLADAARPDSRPSREWMESATLYLFAGDGFDSSRAQALESQLKKWREAAQIVLAMAARREYPALREAEVPAQGVVAATGIAEQAIEALERHQPLGRAWRTESLATLDRAAADNLSATKIPFLPAVRLLTAAAGEPAPGTARGTPEWRARITSIATNALPQP
jgi:hexosaminidase